MSVCCARSPAPMPKLAPEQQQQHPQTVQPYPFVVHSHANHHHKHAFKQSVLYLQGKKIHEEHHQTTYFHVSLDPPWLITSVMGIAAVVFWLLFQGGPLAFTATAAYYAAGKQPTAWQKHAFTVVCAAPTSRHRVHCPIIGCVQRVVQLMQC